ncbi:MAG: hypothetical protein GX591_11515 [Planctomycetes bacterium]|nr:hypothetical protein [Planctomycetota bacterium]
MPETRQRARSNSLWLHHAIKLSIPVIGIIAMAAFHVLTAEMRVQNVCDGANLRHPPPSAHGFRTTGTGKETWNRPARRRTARFEAPIEDINAWIVRSPGTYGVRPTVEGSCRIYSVESHFSRNITVTVDDETCEVVVRID